MTTTLNEWAQGESVAPLLTKVDGCDSCNGAIAGRCDGCDGFFCDDCLTDVSPYVALCPDCIGGAR